MAKYQFAADASITREDDDCAWEFGIDRFPIEETENASDHGGHFRRIILYDWDKETGIRERDALIAFMNSSSHFNGGSDA